jgi:hypothetical protein
MTQINRSNLENIKKTILTECKDGDVGLWEVIGIHVKGEFPGMKGDELKQVTLQVLQELMDEGLIVPGIYNGKEFTYKSWKLNPKETIRYIDEKWSSLGKDPDMENIIIWFVARENVSDENKE